MRFADFLSLLCVAGIFLFMYGDTLFFTFPEAQVSAFLAKYVRIGN